MARNTVLLKFIQSVCHTTLITIIALTFQGQSEGCCSIINTKYRWCTMDVICQVMFQTQTLQGVPKKSLSESSVILRKTMSPQPSFSKSPDLRRIVQKPGWGDMALLKTTEHSKRDFFRPPCIWFSKWAAETHRCQLLGKHMCQSYIWSSWTKRLVRLHTWWSHNLAPRYKDNSQCPKNTQLATNQIFAHAQKDDRSPPVLSLRWWSVQLSIWKPWLLWGANKATVTARNHSGATEHVPGTWRQM